MAITSGSNAWLIQQLYVGYLGRAADQSGLDYWTGLLDSGTSLSDIISQGFATSDEYTSLYSSLTVTQFVAAIYENVLQREPDSSGLAYWVEQVNSGAITEDQLVGVMLDSMAADDQLVWDNRMTAANTYTTTAGDNYSGADAIAAVSQTNSSSFVLTTGIDTADTSGSFRNGSNVEGSFKFTAKSETITGIASTNANNAGSTLTSSDSLIDGSTSDNDVLNLSLTGDGSANTAAAIIQNIETINVTASNTASAVINLTNVTGLETLNISGTPTAGVSVTTTATTGVTTIDGSGLTSVGGTLTADASASTKAIDITGGSAADTLTGGSGNDTITGGAGGDSIVGGAGNDSISGGDGNDSLAGGTGNDTIDGGAGNDTIDGGAGNDVLTGGAGNDSITAGAGNDTVTGGTGNDTINLGTGATDSDTIIFESSASGNGADTINNFSAGTVASGGDVLDFSAFLGTDISFSGTVDGSTSNNLSDYNVIYVDTNTGGTQTYAANSSFVLIQEGNTNTTVDYVTTDANGAISSDTMVATLVGVTGATFVDANFA